MKEVVFTCKGLMRKNYGVQACCLKGYQQRSPCCVLASRSFHSAQRPQQSSKAGSLENCAGLHSRSLTRCPQSNAHFPLSPHISRQLSTQSEYKPDLILFSDSALFKRRYPKAQTISIICAEYGLKIPIQSIETLWNRIYEAKIRSKPLYNPTLYRNNGFNPQDYYMEWHMELLDHILQAFNQFGSPLNDKHISRKLRHRIYMNLTSHRSYYLAPEALHFIKTLRQNQIQYGIVTNSGTHFNDFIKGISERIKQPLFRNDSDNLSIPIANAIDDGIAKPDIRIFLKILKEFSSQRPSLNPLNPDRVYYIGTDPMLDIEPATKLGLRSILITEDFQSPLSDVAHLSPAQASTLKFFRVQNIKELNRLFFASRHDQYVQLPAVPLNRPNHTQKFPKHIHPKKLDFGIKESSLASVESSPKKKFTSQDDLTPL